MNFRSSGLLILVLSGVFVNVPSQTFQWPVDDPKVTQVYACRKCIAGNARYRSGINFHSGVDLKPVDARSFDYTKPVKAAADGWVEKIVEWPNSHGLGNAVILRHENGRYSLYGHLDQIDGSLFPGKFVPQGSHLGIMGNSSSQFERDRSFRTHVHFEIKDNPALGNIADDHKYWGYTPGHPDLYNYHDPRHYVQDISVELITPTAVQNPPPGALNVRSGPGTTYFVTDGGTVTYTNRTYSREIRENQEFVAFKRTFVEGGYWYYIHLPSTNTPLSGSPHPNNGPNGGWVDGNTVVESPFATQIEVFQAAEGLNVRKGPSTDFSVLAKTYTEQRFVTYDPPINGGGCGLPWYKIHLPRSAGARQGWICGDFVNIVK